MQQISCKITGLSPISFSRVLQSPKNRGETDDVYEDRVWRERLHTNADGNVILPPQNLKRCLVDCAEYRSEKIKGKGNQTWTKHFKAGVMIVDPMLIVDPQSNSPIPADSVPGDRLWMNADGKSGGGKRVWRTYPYIVDWRVDALLYVLDPIFVGHLDIVRQYLEAAGQFIGLGRWRPRVGGVYGRFKVSDFSGSDADGT